MCVANLLQLGSLVVAFIGLLFLIVYVYYTKKIAEATLKPAIVAIQGASMDATPHLRNIGNGPAMDVEWEILDSNIRGTLPFIEAGKDSESLGAFSGDRTFAEAGMKANRTTLVCKYRSISGSEYTSTNNYRLEIGRFSTTFNG